MLWSFDIMPRLFFTRLGRAILSLLFLANVSELRRSMFIDQSQFHAVFCGPIHPASLETCVCLCSLSTDVFFFCLCTFFAKCTWWTDFISVKRSADWFGFVKKLCSWLMWLMKWSVSYPSRLEKKIERERGPGQGIKKAQQVYGALAYVICTYHGFCRQFLSSRIGCSLTD